MPAQINFLDMRIINNFLGCSAFEDDSIIKDIASVNNAERIPHIVIREQNP